MALGVAVARMGRLANGRRDREARDRRRLASPGLPLILDMEESPTPRVLHGARVACYRAAGRVFDGAEVHVSTPRPVNAIPKITPEQTNRAFPP